MKLWTIKKLLAWSLTAFVLGASVSGCASSGNKAQSNTETEAQADKDTASDADSKAKTASGTKNTVLRTGVLSFLRTDETSFGDIMKAQSIIGRQLELEGYATSFLPSPEDGREPVFQPVYYDSLGAMVMGVTTGEIDAFAINKTTADYLCATNSNLMPANMFDLEKERTTFADVALSGILNSDFSFMLRSDQQDLCQSFNHILADMKNDGTFDRLIKEQITDVISGDEIQTEKPESFDDADTIRIAVTGALPPMDYVDASGNPAGFNTAVLSEFGKRLHKNIEIKVVDSVGRAFALSSDAVDVVFWTRTNSYFNDAAKHSEEENEEIELELLEEMSDEEAKAFKAFSDIVDLKTYSQIDQPEDTIVTDPYYFDTTVLVVTKD